jgi:hypothetical protein
MYDKYHAQYRTFLQVKIPEYSKKKLCAGNKKLIFAVKQVAKRPIGKYVRKYQNGILFGYLVTL